MSECEEASDLVEPRGIGWREVNVPARMAGEPSFDLGVLVSGGVVDDEVDVELGRNIGVDLAQKPQELQMAMAVLALGEDCAVEDVEFGEQAARAGA